MYQKISISSLGWATVTCPKCGLEGHNKPGREFQNRVLEELVCAARSIRYSLTPEQRPEKCAL